MKKELEKELEKETQPNLQPKPETKEIKKETVPSKEEKIEEKSKIPKMRQIILETDGSNVRVAKAEVAGNIEFVAILQSIIGNVANGNIRLDKTNFLIL